MPSAMCWRRISRDNTPVLPLPAVKGLGPNVEPGGIRQTYVALINAPAALVTGIKIDFPLRPAPQYKRLGRRSGQCGAKAAPASPEQRRCSAGNLFRRDSG